MNFSHAVTTVTCHLPGRSELGWNWSRSSFVSVMHWSTKSLNKPTVFIKHTHQAFQTLLRRFLSSIFGLRWRLGKKPNRDVTLTVAASSSKTFEHICVCFFALNLFKYVIEMPASHVPWLLIFNGWFSLFCAQGPAGPGSEALERQIVAWTEERSTY